MGLWIVVGTLLPIGAMVIGGKFGAVTVNTEVQKSVYVEAPEGVIVMAFGELL